MFKRIWKPVFGYAVAIAAMVYVARHIGINGEAFAQSVASLNPVFIMLALIAFGVHVLFNSLAFGALSQAFGVRLPVSVLSSAWAGSLLAKYVPGGVWQVVGRGLLLERLGVSVRITVVTGVFEQLISLAACGLFVAVTYLLTQSVPVWPLIALVVAAGAAAWLGARMTRVVHPALDRQRFILAISIYTVALIPYAIGYLLLVAPQNPVGFLYALFGGTIFGVLAILVPGGLGVREASVVLLLSSGDSQRVIAAMLVARLLLLVCDAAGTAYGLRSVSGSRTSAEE